MKKTQLCSSYVHTYSLNKGFLRKIFLSIFLISTLVFAPLSLYSQISIKEKNTSLESILNKIEKETSYVFLYNNVTIDDQEKISVDVNSTDINTVLDKVFANINIEYAISGKQIILSPKGKKAAKPSKTVTGIVKDSNGETLIGVNVSVDKKQIGTITDIKGHFSITTNVGDELILSYTGYVSQRITVGAQMAYDITLLEDMIQLDAVVVTALGITRETKSLTYNVQQIEAKDILTVKDANFMGNLAGKVAGVTINQSSSGVGGSTRVVMRGEKSLFGNNDALYVLDGIPMAAMKTEQSENFFESAKQGDSESISMLSADNIETISVLTGAAAAALYGSQGANGVILITSKKGKAGKARISYSNNTTFSNPFVMHKFQNTYGRSGETYYSWGDKSETPLSYKPKDFFRTGTNTTNSLSVSTGGEGFLMHTSLSSTNANGIIPNSEYERYNLSLNTSSDIIKNKLTLDVGVNYVKQKDRNPITQGLYYNPLVAAYLFPPGDDFNRFAPYQIWNPERNFDTQNWSYGDEWLEGTKQNPLWTANKNVFDNTRDKIILSGALTYKPIDWISIALRARIDKSTSTFERRLYASSHTLFAHSIKGNYSDYSMNYQNVYTDFLINIDKQINEDFRFTGNIGGSFNDDQSKYWGYNGPLISAVDFFHMDNVSIEEKKTEQTHSRNNAWYASAQVGYRSMVYLDVTGRVDYFSSMYGPENTSPKVFNPSFGGTAIISEIFGLPRNIVPLWKIRASLSQVGNPPPSFLTREYVKLNNGVISSDSTYPVNLKPEKTKAFEIGTDIKLFDNLIDLSFTYYNTNTFNQLFKYKLPPTSGYSDAYANAGKVNNHGVELTVGINKKIGPVEWNGIIAYSLNKNKVKELLGETVKDPVSGEEMKAPTEFEVAEVNNTYRMLLTKGGTMSDIYVTSFKRSLNGDIYVDPGTGKFEVDKENFVKIGQAAPKYRLSFRNQFTWKDLSLGFMLDARVGGIVVSSTQALLDQYGVSEASGKARDQGGVPINLGKVSAESYYKTIGEGKSGSALSEYTYSATNVRLRELSLSYNIPPQWLDNKLRISVSFVARNLFMIYNKAPHDPEITSNTGTYYQGYDYFMPPSLRNIGFGVNINF